EYAAVWVMRLSKKSDSAFYKTFNTFSGLVDDIAQFASARLNAPRLHYAVVRDLVVTLARPRFTEEVMAQTFAPIDRNAGYAHTASRSPTPESTRQRSRSLVRAGGLRHASSSVVRLRDVMTTRGIHLKAKWSRPIKECLRLWQRLRL
ncbi:hypothetical protein AeNC1_013546, partial [Aphanomyces euteiches]